MYVDHGDYSSARNLLRERLEADPRDTRARRMLVRVLALMGDLGAARKEVDQLIEALGPRSAVPWVEWGRALELAHRYAEALEAYDLAGRADPRDPLGPLTGGLRAAHWGELDLALPRLEQAVKLDSGNPEAWHALGLVRAGLGDLRGAALAYRAGLKVGPGSLTNHLGLATLGLKAGDAEQALHHYTFIARARPRFGDAHLGRALALMKLGRLDEAEEALRAARRLGAAPDALARQVRLLNQLQGLEKSQ